MTGEGGRKGKKGKEGPEPVRGQIRARREKKGRKEGEERSSSSLFPVREGINKRRRKKEGEKGKRGRGIFTDL